MFTGRFIFMNGYFCMLRPISHKNTATVKIGAVKYTKLDEWFKYLKNSSFNPKIGINDNAA